MQAERRAGSSIAVKWDNAKMFAGDPPLVNLRAGRTPVAFVAAQLRRAARALRTAPRNQQPAVINARNAGIVTRRDARRGLPAAERRGCSFLPPDATRPVGRQSREAAKSGARPSRVARILIADAPFRRFGDDGVKRGLADCGSDHRRD